jgi:hypothetical protein
MEEIWVFESKTHPGHSAIPDPKGAAKPAFQCIQSGL